MENQYTKSIIFLYRNDKHTEKEIKEIIPFTIDSRKNKISWNKYNQRRDKQWKFHDSERKIEEDNQKIKRHSMLMDW